MAMVHSSIEQKKMTIEEFWALPEGPPYHEFEEGELILMDQPHSRHQEVLLELGHFVSDHVKHHQLGKVWCEIGVELTEKLGYGPDIVYLSAEHLDRHDAEKGRITGAPDLVVEILSRHSRGRDCVRKFKNYFAAGVPWYWIVDPGELIIEEYRAAAEGYLRTASVAAGEIFRPGLFPGLEINLEELL